MAWEKFSAAPAQGGPGKSLALPLGLSALWLGLIAAAAALTSFEEPYLPFAIAGAFVFFLRGLPSRWEVYSWLAVSVVFVKIIHMPESPFWVLRVACGFAAMGFGALVVLGLRALWSAQEGCEHAVARLVPALLLILFIFVSGRVLSFSGSANPYTDDAWLYASDGTFGFQPSFAMGRVLYQSLILTRCALFTYLSLPFAMAVVCAWQVAAEERRIPWHMLAVLLLAGVAGWIFYNFVPGTGPLYAFGRDFPWHPVGYRDLAGFPLQRMALEAGIPRNAMPSLHVAWAVLLLWNSRGSRVLSGAMGLFLVLTIVATLGTGQHYLVDLAASLPFALAVQAAASYLLPHGFDRGRALLAGLALTGMWLVLVRYGVALALKSPVIPWSFLLASTSVTIGLEGKLAGEGVRARENGRAEPAGENLPANAAGLAITGIPSRPMRPRSKGQNAGG
jgi:hypothetical protein